MIALYITRIYTMLPSDIQRNDLRFRLSSNILHNKHEFDKIICTSIWVKVVFMMNSSNAFLKPHKNNNNISFRHIVIER